MKIIDFSKYPGAFVRKDDEGIVSVHLVNSGNGESVSVINIPVADIIAATPDAKLPEKTSFFSMNAKHDTQRK